MSENTGKVVSINGNLLSVKFDGNVSMNEICYVNTDGTALKSEVIRIRGNIAQIQVYEMTNGIKLLSNSYSPLSLSFISAIISFSGISIIMQSLSFLSIFISISFSITVIVQVFILKKR